MEASGPQVDGSSSLLDEFAAPVYNIEPQIGDLGLDKYGNSCEVIRIGSGLRSIDKIRVFHLKNKPRAVGVGPLDSTQRLHQKRASTRCQTKATMNLTVYEMATACPGRYVNAGRKVMTYVDETFYYESILTKSIVLEMVTSPDSQAAK